MHIKSHFAEMKSLAEKTWVLTWTFLQISSAFCKQAQFTPI